MSIDMWIPFPVPGLIGFWGIRLASIKEGELMAISVVRFGRVYNQDKKLAMLLIAVDRIGATHWYKEDR